MPVRDLARPEVVTAPRDQSAGNLATLMAEEDVGSVVIVDDDERPVGIVTDRDLVIEVLEPRADPRAVTAEAVMTETPVTVSVDEGLFEVTETMVEAAVRRIPVVDDGALAGIITLDDVVVLLAEELHNVGGVIEAESPAY